MADRKNKIVMVAAGMTGTKKKESLWEDVCVNYGCLGIATVLSRKGYDVVCVQGDRRDAAEIVALVCGFFPSRVLISALTVLSIPWLADFTAGLKRELPHVPIVLGGKYFVDKNIPWLKAKLPCVDYYCEGPIDGCEELLLTCRGDIIWENDCERVWGSEGIQGSGERAQGNERDGQTLDCTPSVLSSNAASCYENLDYTLLYDYKKYQPVVEVQRGCGCACSFCPESEYPNGKPKSGACVAEECERICRLYGEKKLNFYFEAACFVPDKKWVCEFSRAYDDCGSEYRWRFTTRVDTYLLGEEETKALANHGLSVVDLGLESASEELLVKMGKTTNPKKYLSSADKVIRMLSSHGVWVKLNIIVYEGQTAKQIDEILSWLEQRRPFIKGLSVNELSYYRRGEPTGLDEQVTFALNEKGFYTVKNENYARMCQFTSERDRLELKKFCYTPRY